MAPLAANTCITTVTGSTSTKTTHIMATRDAPKDSPVTASPHKNSRTTTVWTIDGRL